MGTNDNPTWKAYVIFAVATMLIVSGVWVRFI